MQDIVFPIAILVFSVVAHEVSHGYMAQYLGDPTARLAGRLTLNPIKHLDPIGSVLIPVVLAIAKTGIIFGWAKPVPYNPHNLRDKKWGEVKVALAGPLTNFFIALVFAFFLRAGFVDPHGAAADIVRSIILINIILTIFNLVPIPPLDGSKVLFSALPLRYRYIGDYVERYALALILVFVFFLWQFFLPLVYLLYALLVGAGP